MSHFFDIDQLAAWLEKRQSTTDSLDFHGLHGMLTALCIFDYPLNNSWLSHAIDQNIDEIQPSDATLLIQGCIELQNSIKADLESENSASISFIPEEEYQDSDMQLWCQGFMEVIITQPYTGTQANDEQLALLLMPIEAASGFFCDEEEFSSIYKNKKLAKQMYDSIPDLLTDLYLLIHTP